MIFMEQVNLFKVSFIKIWNIDHKSDIGKTDSYTIFIIRLIVPEEM